MCTVSVKCSSSIRNFCFAQEVHGYMHSAAKKPSVIRQSYSSVNNLGKNILSTSLLCVTSGKNAFNRRTLRRSSQSNEDGFVFPNIVKISVRSCHCQLDLAGNLGGILANRVKMFVSSWISVKYRCDYQGFSKILLEVVSKQPWQRVLHRIFVVRKTMGENLRPVKGHKRRNGTI